MTRVALLGSGGFLGRHAAGALAEAGHEVVPISRAAPLAPQLRSAAAAAVVNCAGLTAGSRSELQAANLDLVRQLLEALAGSRARLVQIGSSAEYGPGTPPRAIAEDHACSPQSDYGRTKLAASNAVLAAAGEGRVDGTVLRVFNPVGAGMSPSSLPGRAAVLMRRALTHGGTVDLGPLDATRDFVDARDVGRAVAAACTAQGVAGRVVNIGSGHGTTARELVATIAAVAGFSGPIGETADGSPRSPTLDWQVADIGLATAVLGWTPRRTLAESVAALWEAGA